MRAHAAQGTPDVFIAACPTCECATEQDENRTSYAGVRVYQNVRAKYAYSPAGTPPEAREKDNLGFGTTMGFRFTPFLRGEYETLYMGASYTGTAGSFEYDIWANMFNGYLYWDIHHAIAPYIGGGVGLTAMWGSVAGVLNNATDISYQAMTGILFEINDRIELEAGFKYINFGHINHTNGTTKINATQLYLGAIYRFGV